ncbi:MAG: biotin transporter BioY [Acutalibacteraceae bacterium]
MKEKSKSTVYSLILCALFAALIAVGAFIKIPVPFVPFTLQLLFTTLAGIVLGPKYGALSVGVYILIGLCGVPIFTQGGGPAYVLQPTFGYLIGFLIGTFVTGLIVHKVPRPSIKRLLVANFSGLLIVYTLGTTTTSSLPCFTPILMQAYGLCSYTVSYFPCREIFLPVLFVPLSENDWFQS